MTNTAGEFAWQRHPEAEAWIGHLTARFLASVPEARHLTQNLLVQTGTCLADWIDHIVVTSGDAVLGQLRDLGFEPEPAPAEPGHRVYHHPAAIFPRILLREESGQEPGNPVVLAIQVEDISYFLMTRQLSLPIEGSLLSPFRRCSVWQTDGHTLQVIERRGHSGFVPTDMAPDYPLRYLRAFEQWATRPRHFADAQAGMEHTLRLAQDLVSDMGVDPAAWIAFSAERDHWERRNLAGQVQKARQDRMGLGWANHDHHTFRSSRARFEHLIKILETFGFRPRERFYAGEEAGWGAQVMEQPVCRFAVFADVDLSPEEVEGDFAHAPLPERSELGTVGLWCALHGDSMLSAGLHHIAGRFAFDAATSDMAKQGIEMMRPFSDFSYLRQAFTRGESWAVDPDRLDRLVAEGVLDSVQRQKFAARGAIGSHLENIQRGEGFKGFNQHTVSDIILRTDPRMD
jgi:hypothetical protein